MILDSFFFLIDLWEYGIEYVVGTALKLKKKLLSTYLVTLSLGANSDFDCFFIMC